MAHRNRVRRHRPDRRPRPPRPSGDLAPRPLVHRGASALGKRRDVRGRPEPSTHRQRSTRDGHAAEPGHQPAPPGRRHQHRQSPTASRPGHQVPDHTAADQLKCRTRTAPRTLPTPWYTEFFTELPNEFWRRAAPPESAEADIDFVERQLGLSPGSRVVDVPCGSGRHSLALTARGHVVTGTDISTEAIAYARQAAADAGLDIDLTVADMRDIPHGKTFDAAICMGTVSATWRSTACGSSWLGLPPLSRPAAEWSSISMRRPRRSCPVSAANPGQCTTGTSRCRRPPTTTSP